MSSYSDPITKNYGFYGVKDNKLVTDDDKLKSLAKYYNHERAESITEVDPLDCDIKNWNVYDWYAEHPCDEQKNTSYLEEALERKGVKPDKFPIFFRSGKMVSLLNQLLFFDSSKEKKINNSYEVAKFNFNPETGLRFIAREKEVDCSSREKKADCSGVLEGKYGHIVEYLLDKRIEIGRELIYLINSLEFPGSGVILFSSKEVDCFWNPEAELHAENVCEVKAFNGLYGIKKKKLLVKNFALGGIRRLAMVTLKNFTTISGFREVEDIETLNENQTLESFYACLNNFTKLIVRHCRENELTGGSVETFRLDMKKEKKNSRFMVIKDESGLIQSWLDCERENSREIKFQNISGVTYLTMIQKISPAG